MSTNFDFPVPIFRAYSDESGYYLEGGASTPALDDHCTRFSDECQLNFERQVEEVKRLMESGVDIDEEDLIQIEAEHKGKELPFYNLGIVEDGEVSNRRFNIKVKLDEENPIAMYYFNVLTNPDPKKGRPKKLGFSINGIAEKYRKVYDKEADKFIYVYDKVRLKKIGITRSPSNPEVGWIKAIARSTLTPDEFEQAIPVKKQKQTLKAAMLELLTNYKEENVEVEGTEENPGGFAVETNDVVKTNEKVVARTEDELKDVSNFPLPGDNRDISLQNSVYFVFPEEYALNIKEQWPSIWKKAKGDKVFDVLVGTVGKKSDELTTQEKNVIKLRERWTAKNLNKKTLSGVLSQVKMLVIGSNGLAFMKDVINQEQKKKRHLLTEKVKKKLARTSAEMTPEPASELNRAAVIYKNYPLNDTPWSGSEAREQLKEWATKENGEIDFSKYKLGFAWYDETKPDLLGSYKFPHHYVLDGNLVTNRRALIAGIAALNGARGGADIPNEDRSSVMNHLKKHLDQFKKTN